MAMNKEVLGLALFNKMVLGKADPSTYTESLSNLTDIADVIITHIQQNAQVTIPSVSGVTTGGGISGPGTGTIA